MRTWLQGKTLAQSRLRETTGATVIGAWEQGKFLEPSPDLTIGESTVLVLGGTEEQLDDFDRSLGHGVGEKPRKGPVIVLGGGRVGRAVADALEKREIDYRVVEKKPVVASKNSRVIQGNAADYDILVQAGIQETPSVIITTHDDNLNIYLTIYCRRLRPDVQIISRASVDRNINTMHRAGADLVMSYTSLVTTTILNLLQPQKILMLSEGLNIFKVELSPRLHGMTLLNAKIREKTGCSVLAVKRGEETMVNPEPDIELKSGDELVLVGTSRAEKEFISRFENPKQD
jgi:Trk K+ transport system NAD-binding subunit